MFEVFSLGAGAFILFEVCCLQWAFITYTRVPALTTFPGPSSPGHWLSAHWALSLPLSVVLCLFVLCVSSRDSQGSSLQKVFLLAALVSAFRGPSGL